MEVNPGEKSWSCLKCGAVTISKNIEHTTIVRCRKCGNDKLYATMAKPSLVNGKKFRNNIADLGLQLLIDAQS